jgi:N,N'-diacetyllegionaminate synthase
MVQPTLILECANAHSGEPEVLMETIRRFSSVDYEHKQIKFQAFHPDTIALPDYEWYPVYRELSFSSEVWREILAKAADAFECVWLDIFDRFGAEVLANNLERVAGVKLQSSVLQNLEVIAALRDLDLRRQRLIVNVSGFEISEIEPLLSGLRRMSFSEVVLQVGHQAYPTSVADTGLQKIPILRAAFPGTPVCIADHAPAENQFAQVIPLLAFALGCEYIEKHVCLRRADAKYDAYSAMEPAETERFAALLSVCPDILNGPFISASERDYLAKTVQIPVASRELRAGTLVADTDLIYRRTAQPGVAHATIRTLQRQHRLLADGIASGDALRENGFRRARIGAIVACRMKSSRLARKALLPLHGRASVERCLENCLMMSDADIVVLATSDLEEDRILESHVLDGKVGFWAGDPDDVIQRYLGACAAHDIDVIIRVTADCPVVSPEIAHHLVDAHFAAGADYMVVVDYSFGTACEIYNAEALRRVIHLMGHAQHSEYMTWYMRNNADIFKVNMVELPSELRRSYRLTLDYPEDLELFEGLFVELDGRGQLPTLDNVFAVLDSTPGLAEVNSHLTLRYKTDPELIGMLDQVTRIRLDEMLTQ